MKRCFTFGLFITSLLFTGCAMTVPIRPYMFIQNEPGEPIVDPMQPLEPAQEAPEDELLPS